MQCDIYKCNHKTLNETHNHRELHSVSARSFAIECQLDIRLLWTSIMIIMISVSKRIEKCVEKCLLGGVWARASFFIFSHCIAFFCSKQIVCAPHFGNECVLRKICYLLDTIQRKAKCMCIVKCTSSSCSILVIPSKHLHSICLSIHYCSVVPQASLLLFNSLFFQWKKCENFTLLHTYRGCTAIATFLAIRKGRKFLHNTKSAYNKKVHRSKSTLCKYLFVFDANKRESSRCNFLHTLNGARNFSTCSTHICVNGRFSNAILIR